MIKIKTWGGQSRVLRVIYIKCDLEKEGKEYEDSASYCYNWNEPIW